MLLFLTDQWKPSLFKHPQKQKVQCLLPRHQRHSGIELQRTCSDFWPGMVSRWSRAGGCESMQTRSAGRRWQILGQGQPTLRQLPGPLAPLLSCQECSQPLSLWLTSFFKLIFLFCQRKINCELHFSSPPSNVEARLPASFCSPLQPLGRYCPEHALYKHLGWFPKKQWLILDHEDNIRNKLIESKIEQHALYIVMLFNFNFQAPILFQTGI